MFEFLGCTFRQEIHRGRQCDHDQGERHVDESGGEGRDGDENGDEVFCASFFLNGLNSGS